MNWVKTYESYIYEAAASKAVTDLEKVLKLPSNTGIIKNVMFDKARKDLYIEQPTDISAMDAGAVLAAINKEKAAIKKLYPGVEFIMVGDLQIKV